MPQPEYIIVFFIGMVAFALLRPLFWKLPLHLKIDDIAVRMRDTGRCGWYLAVEQPGIMPTNGTLKLVTSDPAQPTVAWVFAAKMRANPPIPTLP